MNIDFFHVVDWHDAGSPLDKSFIITRGYAGDERRPGEDLSDWSRAALDSVCERVLFSVNSFKDELRAETFTLAPNTIHTQYSNLCFTYLYQGHSFAILVERLVRHLSLEASAIVILHSKERNG